MYIHIHVHADPHADNIEEGALPPPKMGGDKASWGGARPMNQSIT